MENGDVWRISAVTFSAGEIILLEKREEFHDLAVEEGCGGGGRDGTGGETNKSVKGGVFPFDMFEGEYGMGTRKFRK